MADISNEALMAQLADGDMWALGELFARNAATVKGVLCRISPELPDAEADELLQDVFLILYKTATRYTEQQKFKAWLCGIAVNCSKKWRRNTWLRRKLIKEHFAAMESMDKQTVTTPEGHSSTRQQLKIALSRISPKHRDVLMLHLEGFSGPEIANILGVRENVIWTRLHRARNKIAELLSDELCSALIRKGSVSDPVY